MIYVSATSLGKGSYKVTVLCYCIENNVHQQKEVKNNFLAFRKTNIKIQKLLHTQQKNSRASKLHKPDRKKKKTLPASS